MLQISHWYYLHISVKNVISMQVIKSHKELYKPPAMFLQNQKTGVFLNSTSGILFYFTNIFCRPEK